MKATEITVATLAIIDLLLKILHLPGADFILVISLTILSFLYFYLGWTYFNDIRLRKLFNAESYRNLEPKKLALTIFASMALSTSSIGIMFKLLHLPGAEVMLTLGAIGCGVAAFILVFTRHNQKRSFFKLFFIRLGIFLIISLLMFY